MPQFAYKLLNPAYERTRLRFLPCKPLITRDHLEPHKCRADNNRPYLYEPASNGRDEGAGIRQPLKFQPKGHPQDEETTNGRVRADE